MEAFEFVLLPGEGLILPRGAGLLGFGATRESARRRLAWLGSVSSPFVCGVEWTWHVRTADRVVEACSGDDGLLGEITLSRSPCYAWGEPAGMPTMYQNLDVFARAVSDLDDALAMPGDGSIGCHPLRQPRPAYVAAVSLTDTTRVGRRGTRGRS